MTTEDSGPPAGWYPDPSGQRQWRIWNGRSWSDATRTYGEEPHPRAATVPAVLALNSLIRYGVLCYFAGAGLVIDAVHHRPAPFTSLSNSSYLAMLFVGVGLFMVGHRQFSRALGSLLDGPHPVTYLPVLNLLAWVRYAYLRSSITFPVIWRPVTSRAEAVAGARIAQLFVLLSLVGYALSPLPTSWFLSVSSHLLPAFGATLNRRWAIQLRNDLTGVGASASP